MKRNVMYTQCTMRRIVAGASIVTTSYVPSKFAKVGHVLKLKNEYDRWVDGWTVESVSSATLRERAVPNYRKAIRNHRKSTGDSAPRLNA